ncbi:conserved Plasmodium protein, unknown function [Plasmodium ovale]|uniref:SNARE protein n=2 Tax=Plasmodium ovale TaxID=36330 RepID=A0A1A8WXW4_PLAOA|nr:conserved Plasmodium protein, unknown function [Plasmodium ovale curtisi]SBS96724.1 conserved Plasmodium protein, unknown function [Plasmodium ovale curtisi]SCP05591.1 conserved Plasmodium protein, unknown function [Plasmodium ovale]
MKKNYGILNDDEKNCDYNESIRYREYKRNVRNAQINFEQILSDFKEGLNNYEHEMFRKKDDEMNEYLCYNKKKIEQLENLHKDGIQNLDIMKNYFSHNTTYSIEIARYLTIFDKFRIQLQTVKSTFDKISLHNNIHVLYKKIDPPLRSDNNSNASKTTNTFNTANRSIDHVFKERSALEHSLSELDNMISIGQETSLKLKIQNSNIVQQLKKINIINTHLPQIQKILKNIKHHNIKRTAILSLVIALCIFAFFMFR